MTTKAQLTKEYRNVRIYGYSVLGGMLAISLAANALSALQYGNDPVGVGIAAIPPVSLFASSSLLERIRVTRWYWVVLMVLAALASLAFSWVHIAQVAMIHHQSELMSWLLPIAIDVPMILAGKMIIDHRAPATPQPRPTPAKRTTPAKATPKTNGVKPTITAKHLATVKS
jgi:hypothetical protein